MNQSPLTPPAPPATSQAAPIPPPATPSSLSGRARLATDRVRQIVRALPARLRALPGQMRKSWPWLLVGLMYIGAWWIPLQWAKHEWFRAHHVEIFQPYLPFATAFLIYARRRELREVWARALRKRRTRNIGFWERGNLIPLLSGCILLLLMHLIQMKGVSVIALILIGVGVAYLMFGGRVLRAMAAPWCLLVFMIPLPDSLLDKLGKVGLAVTLQALIAMLRLLHRPAVVEGSGIRYLGSNFIVNLSAPGIGESILDVPIGIDIAVGVALALLIYGLYKRRNSLQIAGAVLNGAILSLLINFARMLIVALIAERYPTIAERLRDYNAWVMVFLVSVLTEYLVRTQARWWGRWFTRKSGSRQGSPFAYILQRAGYFASLPFLPLFMALGLVSRAGGGVGHMARRNERRTEQVLKSVSPFTRVLLLPLTLLQRSEKGIERLMRRATKKRGRGSSSRSRSGRR